MGKKSKKKEVKFTLQTLIRIIIFAILIYFLIFFFSSNQRKNITEDKSDSKVLGTFNSIYNSIPEQSRYQIENIDKLPFVVSVSEKISEIQQQGQKSLDTQIKNLKKEIAKRVYNQVVKNIDGKN